MQTIDIAYKSGDDLVITVNGTPIWASTTEARKATDGLTVAPLPGSVGADPDLTTALDELTEQHGIVAVQLMIRTIRHNENGPAVSEWLAGKAADDIADLMRTSKNLSYADARSRIGKRWGYSGTSMTNFYKIADRGWYLKNGNGDVD
jgi:hypothetical protein